MSTAVYNSIGHYKIVRELGRGIATVCLAVDQRTGQQAALKLVLREGDNETRDRLQAERHGAELQRRFSDICDLVPKVYECFETEQYFCIAMEYVPGEDMSSAIARGPMDEAQCLIITLALCRFLETAHGFETTIDGHHYRVLLHGDLKPRNVRLLPDGTPKVLDFGIAKAQSLTRSVTRSDFHSLPYSSPERLETGKMPPHADLWAVGVMCYEMLKGEPPFSASSVPALERAIRGRRVPPLPETISPGMRAIVSKMLAPSVGVRYATPAEIRADLERCAAQLNTVAQAEGFPATAADLEATRRTTGADAADADAEPLDTEATRRTSGPIHTIDAAPTIATAPPVPVAAPAAPARPKRRFIKRAILLIAVFLVVNEACVARAASRLSARVPALELTELAPVWVEYDKLAGDSNLGWGVAPLGRALRERTDELAERVFSNYRTPAPSVREVHWRAVRDGMRRALALSPGDRRIRASIEYAQGHLYRIDGEQRLEERKNQEAREQFSQAITSFRAAAELRPEWPDPLLGLFRTFVRGMDDVDRGQVALDQARRYGYTPTERETAQLGDGYRGRGNTLYAAARQMHDLPQEEDHLKRAREAYETALRHYLRVPTYGNTGSQIRVTQRALERVNERLSEIEAERGLAGALGTLIQRWR